MARQKRFDSPEYDKAQLRRQPVLFPPPREPKGPKDHGLLYRTGLGGGTGYLPKFQTADEMEDAIQVYFDYVEENSLPPTLAGLSLALGFKSVSTLRNYENKGEDYSDVITVAKTRIEDWKNTALLNAEKQCHGIIFDLKNNHGWADKIEQKTTHEVGGTLAELLTQLQGNVLRPAPILEDQSDQVIDAEFTSVQPIPVVQEPEIPDDLADLV